LQTETSIYYGYIHYPIQARRGLPNPPPFTDCPYKLFLQSVSEFIRGMTFFPFRMRLKAFTDKEGDPT